MEQNKEAAQLHSYPYLCSSQKLIEAFYIIGFSKEQLDNPDNLVQIMKKSLQTSEYRLEGEKPTVINSIVSDYTEIQMDLDLIAKLIFPNEVRFQDLSSDDIDESKLTPYTVISFFNNDSTKGDFKQTVNYFGYVFYEKVCVLKDKILAVPKCFCIVSQYPYFNFYYNLLGRLNKLMNSEVDFPLELYMHNIVNYIPSPLNNNVIIKLENVFTCSPKIIVESEVNVTKNPSELNDSGNLTENKQEEESFAPNDSQMSFMPSKEMILQDNRFTPVKREFNTFLLKAPTGYPICDYKVDTIFHIVPKNMVVAILVFSFLEIDMLFFSKKLEILNLILYTFALISYPCTDTQYLWSVASISKEELKDGTNAYFIGKPFTSMLGVNCTWSVNIETINFSNSHFIVDLDNKEMFFRNYEMKDQDNDIKKLFDFITSSNASKTQTQSNSNTIINQGKFLSKSLDKLYCQINVLLPKVIKRARNPTGAGSGIIEEDHLEIDFYEHGKEINENDKSFIAFSYEFLIDFLKEYYNTFGLVRDKKEDKYKVLQNLESPSFTDEELIFIKLFKNTFKSKSFFEEYIINRKCLDTYRIPYMFAEEFILLKNSGTIEQFHQLAFLIIDHYFKKYRSGNSKDEFIVFDEFNKFLLKDREDLDNPCNEVLIGDENTTTPNPKDPIDINQIAKPSISNVSNKKKDYHSYFKTQFIESDNSYKPNPNAKNHKYKYIKFDNELLFEYKYLIKNHFKNMENIFPTISKIKSNSIPCIPTDELDSFLEFIIVANKMAFNKDYFTVSYLNISALLGDAFGFKKKIIEKCFKNLRFSQKYYIKLYQKILNYIFKKLLEKKNLIKENPDINMESEIDRRINKYKKLIKQIYNYLIFIKLIPDKEIIDNMYELRKLLQKLNSELNDSDSLIINKYKLNTFESIQDEDVIVVEKNTRKGSAENCVAEFKKEKASKYLLEFTITENGLNVAEENQSKALDTVLSLACNIGFRGNLTEKKYQKNNKEAKPLGMKVSINGMQIHETKIYSPLKLYFQSKKLLKEYLSCFNFYNLDSYNTKNTLSNLIFYLLHNSNFKNYNFDILIEALIAITGRK